MNDTLKVAGRIGAELGAAKAENDRLRGLLQQVVDCQAEHYGDGCGLHLSMITLAGRIKDALSQQPEPTDTYTAVDMATAAAQGFRDGQAAVEHQSLNEWFASLEPGRQAVLREDKWMLANAAFEAGCATRPAQTEQQPQDEIPKPDGWVAAGRFFADRDEAIAAAEKTPCVDVYLRPSLLTVLARSAVTAERDRLLQEKGDPAGSFEKCMQAMRDRDEHARTIDRLRAEVERLRRQLQTAHSFIESTEAFGSAAASGILECAGAVWNIDESKALIAAMAAKEA